MPQCPACTNHLRVVHIEAIEIDVCDRCDAVWLDRGELNEMTRRSLPSKVLQDESASQPALELPTLSNHTQTDLCCPRCQTNDFSDLAVASATASRCNGCGGVYVGNDCLKRLRGQLSDQDVPVASANSDESDKTGTSTTTAVDIIGNGLFELLIQVIFFA